MQSNPDPRPAAPDASAHRSHRVIRPPHTLFDDAATPAGTAVRS